MKKCVSKNENAMSFTKQDINGMQRVQKYIHLCQIKRLIFTVAILLFSVMFINEAKAETVDEVPKELFGNINVQFDDIQDDNFSEVDMPEVEVSVEYGEVSEEGVITVRGVTKPTYTTYKDVTFRLGNSSYITFRISLYYYYADGDYAEIYYYAVQKLTEFCSIGSSKEYEGIITHHGTFSRLTLRYEVVFYAASEYVYLTTTVLDIDYWGDITVNLSMGKRIDILGF